MDIALAMTRPFEAQDELSRAWGRQAVPSGAEAR
jgi:hypothetical protein